MRNIQNVNRETYFDDVFEISIRRNLFVLLASERRRVDGVRFSDASIRNVAIGGHIAMAKHDIPIGSVSIC